MKELNLCEELSNVMVKLGFKEEAINHFKSSQHYITSYNSSAPVKRTMLIMYFYNLMMYKSEPIPKNIRIALNAATGSLVWYEDMATIVLPFLQVNQDIFYP